MDTIEVVDRMRQKQIDDAQTWLGRLKDEGFPIHAAYWAKRPDDDRWHLYLATPALEKHGIIEAYDQVLKALRLLGNYSARASDAIKLVGQHDPVAKDVLNFQKLYPDLIRQDLKEQRFGGKTLDVCIYPLGDVPITLYGMYFEEGPRPALHLAFEPHNPNSRMLVERAGQGPIEYVAKTGQDYQIAAPEGAQLQRDEYGMLILSVDIQGKKRQLNPNTVFAFAQLGQHGFRVLREPSVAVMYDEAKNGPNSN